MGLGPASFVMSQKICHHLKSHLLFKMANQTRSATCSKGERLTKNSRGTTPWRLARTKVIGVKVTGTQWLDWCKSDRCKVIGANWSPHMDLDGYKRTLFETMCVHPPPTAEDHQRGTHRTPQDPGWWLSFLVFLILISLSPFSLSSLFSSFLLHLLHTAYARPLPLEL